ncbi:TPA: helix-turn-helix domain-containing protein [Pseudomonas putida]|nr:helix-turn-helix domain-containing protein [Pseudomonas putida]
MPNTKRPIDEVVRLAGGQAELARRCNTSQPRIWQCVHRNQKVPADRDKHCAWNSVAPVDDRNTCESIQ